MSLSSIHRSFAAAGAAFALIAALSMALSTAPVRAADRLEASLRQVMDDSASGWSAGDLDRFMSVYEQSPAATYVGAKGLVQGYAAIRAMYAPRFTPGGQAPHGMLTFDLLQTSALGADHALLVGRYHLQPTTPGGAEASGIFSLTFHRKGGQWRIVCDHTS